MKYSIKDKLFSHAFSTSNWFKPTHFEWDFQNINGDFVFFTDANVRDVANPEYAHLKKYAWLVESPAVTPDAYSFVYKNASLYDKIFTHSEKILQYPHAYLVPIGGCHLDQEEIQLYEKSKLISMIYSHKNFAQGHNMRHEIAYKYREFVDVMGSGVDGKHLKKIHACKDYAFQVVIENCKEGYYFTEKLIDCFLSGTIPIYWGSEYIEKFFNRSGYLTFDTLEELYQIIKNPANLVQFYNDHQEEVKENFQKALEHKIGEDYLYKHYKDIL